MEPALTPSSLREQWLIPGAILLAGLVLALAVYYVRHSHVVATVTGDLAAVLPVSPSDHILGNPTAPVVLIEYADIDSEFSKQFQTSLEQLMHDYAAGGKVAWVYRHFPLTTEHINAETHAEAAECVSEIAGKDMFYRFIDLIQANAPGSEQFNPAQYEGILSQLGIDNTKFSACLASNKYEALVRTQFDNALATGGTGAPFTILLIRGNPPVAINGALPYTALKQIVDSAITKVK